MDESTHPKVARPDHDILDVIRRRWSPRAFDAAREITRTELRRLFEAARWAPSSRNEQPWRFVVADKGRSPVAFAAIHASLGSRNQAWAGGASVLIVTTVRRTHEIDDVANTHAWYDTGQAVAFLTLQATAMELSVRQMQGFDRDGARAACAIPEPFDPAVVMAVGYLASPETLKVDAHREAELAPRHRRAIDTFVFEGTWGRPLA